jgi:hypothetical protein
VKSILLACEKDEMIEALVADLQNYERGTQHDETQWLDVGLHPAGFTPAERAVWDTLPRIFAVRGGRPGRIKDVRAASQHGA